MCDFNFKNSFLFRIYAFGINYLTRFYILSMNVILKLGEEREFSTRDFFDIKLMCVFISGMCIYSEKKITCVNCSLTQIILN